MELLFFTLPNGEEFTTADQALKLGLRARVLSQQREQTRFCFRG
jgi:hypothetical protein